MEFKKKAGMVISVKLSQYPKASLPIDITLSGIIIFVKLEQNSKALFPIDIKLSGMIAFVN